MNKKANIFFSGFVATFIFYTPIQGQYFRDNTKFIHLDGLYPVNDSNVLDMYAKIEKYPLTFHEVYNEPEIMVGLFDKKYPLIFDFGNNGNIVITKALADSVKYSITDTVNTYTSDGNPRGQVYDITIPEFSVFGQTYHNEKATLMDRAITSSAPYNGLPGLKYLKDQ